jgi:SulP family sulfate permease
LFFVNTANIGDKMRRLIGTENPRVVVFDLSAVPDVEYTALKVLTEVVNKFRLRGMSLWLVGLNPGVLQTIQRSSLGDVLGREAMHFNVEVAVAKYLAMPSISEPTN